MPASRTYHIRPVLDGQTLASALRGLNAKLSWTDARKLIHNRHIQVNGNLVLDEARRLKTGDVVRMNWATYRFTREPLGFGERAE